VPSRPEPDRTAALRDERAELLRFCADLTDSEWFAASAAPGWQVKDVLAHIGAGCHALFTPAALVMLRSKDIERTNDVMVDARRARAPGDVLDEFTRWSARVVRLSGVVAATPLKALRLPLAELGRFRLNLLLGGALAFDQHTHLRFDMAPALGRDVAPTDDNRMSVVIEWMLAVLGNQLRRARPDWMDQPVRLTLSGLGGGCWTISGDGTIVTGETQKVAAATIFAAAEQFPEWGTRRAAWRDRTVTVEGSLEYGAKFLDAMNVV
jgi:uncharacterized protein (TIGR03083 family)